jgi:Putative Actinobacterial Holin-X, holin superfamily III
MTGNGAPPGADKNLGDIVSEVSEKASLLIRQEIDLAKAEVSSKLSKLTRGVGVGAAAGVFLIFGITMFFHTLAWFLVDLFDFSQIWYGFAIVTAILFVLSILAALLAYRLFKKGSPPVPAMAIEEAKLTRADLEAQSIQRDQLERSKT